MSKRLDELMAMMLEMKSGRQTAFGKEDRGEEEKLIVEESLGKRTLSCDLTKCRKSRDPRNLLGFL